MSNQSNLLSLASTEFIRRIDVSDLPGFFSKSVEIPQGLHALAFVDGVSIGEISPGTYTFQQFSDKLKFWRENKNVVLYLYRSGVINVFFDLKEFQTKENLKVNIVLNISFKFENIILLIQNYLGGQELMTETDIQSLLSPYIRQGLKETIKSMSVEEITGIDSREIMDAVLNQRLNRLDASLVRLGFKFENVNLATVSHDQYDELQNKSAEIWLMKEGQIVAEELTKLKNEQAYQNLKNKEHENDLDILAQQLSIDHKEGQYAVRSRRLELRRKWRQMLLSDRFNEIENQDQLEKMLNEQENAKLIRAEEQKELLDTFEAEKNDRQNSRIHLLKKLDIQQAFEIQEMEAQLRFDEKMKRLDFDAEIAKKIDTDSNRRWLIQIEQEKKERQEEFDRIQSQQLLELEKSGFRRDEEWTELLHLQRKQKLQSEMELDKTFGVQRIEKVKIEIVEQKKRSDMKLEQEYAEMTREIEREKSDDDFAERERRRESHRRQTLFDVEQIERLSRLKHELSFLDKQTEQTHELAVLKEKRQFQGHGILSILDPDNADAYVKIIEAEQDAQKNSRTSEAVFQERERADKEKTDLYAQMQEIQEKNAQRQQDTLNQMLSTLGQIGTAPQPTVVVPGAMPMMGAPFTGGMLGTGTAESTEKIVCSGCRTANPPTNKFCGNCGKPL